MLLPMTLSELLAGGTSTFNAKRQRGEVPLDLTGTLAEHDQDAFAKLGDFIALHRTELPPLVEDD